MALIDHIQLDRVLVTEFASLEAARERGSLAALLGWFERHTGLSRDALLEHGVDEFGAIVEQIRVALSEVPIEQQREVKRLKDGRPKRPPLWTMFMRLADGDPLRAQQLERELTQIWLERKFVWDRGGPEGEYLSGGPVRTA